MPAFILTHLFRQNNPAMRITFGQVVSYTQTSGGKSRLTRTIRKERWKWMKKMSFLIVFNVFALIFIALRNELEQFEGGSEIVKMAFVPAIHRQTIFFHLSIFLVAPVGAVNWVKIITLILLCSIIVEIFCMFQWFQLLFGFSATFVHRKRSRKLSISTEKKTFSNLS